MSDTIKVYINQTQPVKAITVAPTGATGAAGPNAVTSATTSNGTATLSTSTLTTGTLTVSTSGVFNATTYTYGTGAAAAHRTALGLGTLATQSGTFSGTSSGTNTGDQDLSGYALTSSLGTSAAFDSDPTANPNTEDVVTTAVAQTLTNKTLTSPVINSATIGTAATFNATTYTYGTGAASAHKAALNLFTLLTLQESDAGVYTANAGTAAAGADGDSLSLSAGTANQRPNVYRFRNWNKNPGVSGTANSVTPVKLASAGNIYHLGSGANGASLRCGFGMVNGASAVAANANATTGKGFGWRMAWNTSTSKLEFNLWAHDGTNYVEDTGIDTGLGAGNLDGIFNVIVALASDGTVSANTWFGSQTSTSSVPSSTPTVTLAGGPTSGTFANLGTPSWIAAAHSTTAPAAGNSIIARIVNRKLYIG